MLPTKFEVSLPSCFRDDYWRTTPEHLSLVLIHGGESRRSLPKQTRWRKQPKKRFFSFFLWSLWCSNVKVHIKTFSTVFLVHRILFHDISSRTSSKMRVTRFKTREFSTCLIVITYGFFSKIHCFVYIYVYLLKPLTLKSCNMSSSKHWCPFWLE
jgi:hypothetical protein